MHHFLGRNLVNLLSIDNCCFGEVHILFSCNSEPVACNLLGIGLVHIEHSGLGGILLHCDDIKKRSNYLFR